MTDVTVGLRGDLWAWSCAVYEGEGVALAALALQDRHDLNVNAALWAVWAGERGAAIDPVSAAAGARALQPFHPVITRQIRAARHALRAPIAGVSPEDGADLKAKLFAVELEAERIEQHCLEAVSLPAHAKASALENLKRVAEAFVGPGDPSRNDALATFCDVVVKASAALHDRGRVS